MEVTGEGSVKTSVSPTVETAKTVVVAESRKEKVVPEHEYVGVKEMLRKREQEIESLQSTHESEVITLQTQIQELVEAKKNLEEQSKTKVNQEELVKVQEALVKKTDEVLEVRKDLICTKYGVDKEALKDLSGADLRAFEKGLSLGKVKSPATRPDIGGSGGGFSELKGSPLELATEAYSRTK